MSEHIPGDLALIIAALDADDAQRCAALAHARECTQCAGVIREGQAMLELLDAHVHEVPIDPQLKARIMATIAHAPQPNRFARWEQHALVFGMMLSACLAWIDGHARTGLYPARGLYCVLWEVLGAALVTIGASLWSRWGRRVPPKRFALLGTCGALLGQLWLRHRCPTHHAGLHLVVYHVTFVLLIACAGLWAVRERAKPAA
jgi:uncharacterized membrane protein YsdA (DUF1294 family)